MVESSPFAPFLGTNYAPSEGEVQLLKHFVEHQHATVTALVGKIEAMKRLMTELEVEHEQRLRSIEEHSKLLSPIRRVPNEILSLILVHCLGANVHRPSPPKSISVVVSHVSRHWRDLALQTPQLWSTIRIKIPYLPRNLTPLNAYRIWTTKMNQLRYRTQAWIHRSSPYPIELHLTTNDAVSALRGTEHEVHAYQQVALITDTISLALPRIREVHYDLEFDSLCHCAKLFDRSPEDYPLLRKIVISTDSEEDVDYRGDMAAARTCLTEMAKSAAFFIPSLRCFEVDGLWFDIRKANKVSPRPLYENLEHLVFRAEVLDDDEFFHERHALELLYSLPTLLTCDLQLSRVGYPMSLSAMEVAKMDRLTSLTLDYDLIAEDFVDYLELPSLWSIHLHAHPAIHPGDEREAEAVDGDKGGLQLLLKFGEQLNALTMCPSSIAHHELPRVLQQLKNVEILAFHYRYWPLSTEKHLYCFGELSTAGICPKLRWLEIDRITNTTQEVGVDLALVHLIAARRATRSTPQEKHITVNGTASVSYIQGIKARFSHKRQVDIRVELERLRVDLSGLCLDLAYLSV